MKNVAHQLMCIKYILGLSKYIGCYPGCCIDMFFTKLQTASTAYKELFVNENIQLVEEICKLVDEKLEKNVGVI